MDKRTEIMMEWNKITIYTTTQAVDFLSSELYDIGIQGIEVEDHIPLTQDEIDTMFVEVLSDHEPVDDGKASVHCYIDRDMNLEDTILKIQGILHDISSYVDIGEGKIDDSVTKEEDWVNNWKKFFKPLRLDDTIVIKPTWEALTDEKEDDIVIEIDPGTAFGTGSHETTRLCIDGMKEQIHKDTRMLDVGCGSGILSIIGLKLGANHAVMTDIDPRAIAPAKENMKVNHITEDQFEVYQGNVLEDDAFCVSLGEHTYDLVVANILADVIIPLTSIVGRFLKADGRFVISGIINTKEQDVIHQLEQYGFEVESRRTMKEWVSMTAKRKNESCTDFL